MTVERVRERRPPSERVAVDVFIPVYKEPPDIVDLTVAAAVGLRGADVRCDGPAVCHAGSTRKGYGSEH